MRLSLVALVAFICVLGFASAQSSLENVKVERAISLTSNIARHFIDVEVTNTGSRDETEYLIAIPAAKASSLAYLAVGDKEGNQWEVSRQESGMLSRPGFVFYAAKFPTPLSSRASINLRIVEAYGGAMRPFPAEIEQTASQLVKYDDDIYFVSPYVSREQRTTVRLASATVKHFSEQRPTTRRNDEIIYGKYLNVEAFADEPMNLHFENNTPFATLTEVRRDIDISHWRGEVSVEETVSVRHDGAKLAGVFSRLDFQRMQAGVSSFRALTAFLPLSAADVYFRDEIGNISSSSLRTEEDKQHLELRLRYPMFGGWNNSFYYGYNMPLAETVTAAAGQYTVSVPFGSHLVGVPAESVSLRVALPEGADVVSVSAPFEVAESRDTYKSFLDLNPRTVVVLSKRNVVPEHNALVSVTYTYSSVNALMKPLRVVAALLVGFGIVIAVRRIDLSFSARKQKSA